jgi:8-oxo-dGTP diphosphatase
MTAAMHQTTDTLDSAHQGPVVELRVVTLTFAHGALYTFVANSGQNGHLPNTVPVQGESLDETAMRLLRANLGFSEQYMEQLYSLSHSDSGSWSIIVSYLALVCTEGELASLDEGEWVLASNVEFLSEGDRMVVEYGLFRLRAKLGYTTIAFHLMPPLFTLSELQTVFETILGRTLDKRNFRRRMATLGILAGSRQTRRDGSHRPARLYRFLPDHDPTDYLTPPWATVPPGEQTS